MNAVTEKVRDIDLLGMWVYGNAFRSPELHRSTVASTLHQPALWGVLLNAFFSGVTDQSVSWGSEGHKTWRIQLIRS